MDYDHNNKHISIILGIVVVAIVAIASSISIGAKSNAPKNNTYNTNTQSSQETPKEEVKKETKRTDIDYEKREVLDSNLEYGKTEVRTVGKKGVKAHVYEVTYVDGKEESRKQIDEYVEKEPVAEVVAKGTKILWHCVDVTSYDRNPYNDNRCTSSTGEVRYLSDYQAEALDTSYRAGKSGAYYYNNK